MAALQKLAEKCEFGEFIDQELRDKLVCGIWNETIQRKLLTEKELIAARAYELARGMEAAYQQSTQLQTAQQEQKAYKVTSPVEPKSIVPCWRCGKLGYLADQCFFQSKQCRRCGKIGHIAKMCRQRTSNGAPTQATQRMPMQNRARYVEQEESETTTSDTSDLGLFTIRSINGNHSGEIHITPKVNGVPIQMELDTGASVSLISTHVWEQSLNKTPLETTSMVLKTFTRERLEIRGQVDCQFANTNQMLYQRKPHHCLIYHKSMCYLSELIN